MAEPYSIYIHIPFCKKKCGYCDFLSFADMSRADEYVAALNKEMKQAAADYKGRELKSVFIGGGTPTCLTVAQLHEVLKTLAENYHISEKTEFSVEANPDSITGEKLGLLREYGINRLSIGVQAFDDRILERIGRIHSSDRAIDAYEMARAASFENINIDLMFGLPGQSMADWEKSLRMALSLSPQHISCYSLTLEEDASFARDNKDMPDEKSEREMYYLANKMLGAMGYERYEISNFAKPGFECRHNIVYWTLGEYISFGLGAHSFTGSVRCHNTTHITEYLAGDYSCRDVISLTQQDLYSEFMFLGMRMTRGICEREFEQKFNLSMSRIFGAKLASLEARGLVCSGGGKYHLSEKGADLANIVFSELI